MIPRGLSLDTRRIRVHVSALEEEVEGLLRGVAREELSPHSPFMLALKKGETEEQRGQNSRAAQVLIGCGAEQLLLRPCFLDGCQFEFDERR